ncbi:MAG: sulfurtransferase, partial [Chitinophagaceae bacterium]|nr:sulfurtransferase [Chitinophagaceae bacterium]
MQHSPEFLKLVDDAKTHIKEFSVAETQQRMKEGAN